MWSQRIAQIFLDVYLETARGASFIPEDSATFAMLLDLYLIEKAAYEVCYELNNRPDWIFVPLRGITRILGQRRN
jgi:maltose alpha-D-glucosyltransferase/alpha-amylase